MWFAVHDLMLFGVNVHNRTFTAENGPLIAPKFPLTTTLNLRMY